jgi:TfoX/Sxy family transcriptional regulator of competence genes
MATKILKQYQENTVDELVMKTKLLLHKNVDKKTIVFQAPTGSGKTFMMSQYIEQMIEEMKDEDLCFLWLSPGKGALHEQSFKSLKKEFAGFPAVYLLEEEFIGSRRAIDKNEVVIGNWEKLSNKDGKSGEWKSRLMKDKETVNFRELIENTRDTEVKRGASILAPIDILKPSFQDSEIYTLRQLLCGDALSCNQWIEYAFKILKIKGVKMSNKLVILMAGESKRFTEAGYNKKYFLPVCYKNRTYPMFIQTIRNIKNEFSKVKQKYFKEIVIAHNDNPFLIKYWLNKANIKATLINVGKTNGSLETLLKFFSNENKINEYVVANVDQLFTFNNELSEVDKLNLNKT